MSRAPFHVRSVELTDADALSSLWHFSGERSAVTPGTDIPSTIRKVLAGVRDQIVVAEVGGVVVGAAYLQVAPLMPVTSEQAVFVSMLRVHEDFRSRGVARGLMEAAVTWAEKHGTSHVVTLTPGNSRDTNRFLARLGLSPVASVRVAATAALRAKLPVEVPSVVRGRAASPAGRGNLGQVLAARRATRRSQNV